MWKLILLEEMIHGELRTNKIKLKTDDKTTEMAEIFNSELLALS